MTYKQRIEPVLKGVVDLDPQSEESRLWNEWLETVKGLSRDVMVSLLASGVRQEFKARALVVLLAPSLRIVPFWRSDFFSDFTSCPEEIKAKDIPIELIEFACKLLCCNLDHARRMDNSDMDEVRFLYNRTILEFLPALDERQELARELFSRFKINDPVPFQSNAGASGYYPLRDLFMAKHIPHKWKVLADRQVRKQIIGEIKGRLSPRRDWEVALDRYADHIETSQWDGDKVYAKRLFASQIKFIVNLPGIERLIGHNLFSPCRTAHLLRGISGIRFRETRHKLARLLVLRKNEAGRPRFYVSDYGEALEAAHMMRNEFGADDQELFDALTGWITHVEDVRVKETDSEREYRLRIEALLKKMS